MANLVVTSTTNSIRVVFNDQSFFDRRDGETYSKGAWNKSDIANMKFATDKVIVQERDGFTWRVSYNGTTGTFTVDSVDGANPSSDSDLYDKLIALIA